MRVLQNEEFEGYLQVFIAGVLWGCIGPFIQLMEQYGSSFVFTSFLRMAFSFVILAVITITKFGFFSLRVSKKTLLFCALLGIVCHGIYNVFYSIAVTLTGVTVSAVLMNTAPVFTTVFSYFWLREKITWIKSAAMIVNIMGCTLAATGGKFDVMLFSLIGVLCGIASGFCYGMTAIIGKLAGEKSNAFVISTYSYLFAAVFLVVFMNPWGQAVPLNESVLLLGFLYALIPTAIAYIFYYQGLQKITESSKVPVIASVEAVVAAVIGVAIFREQVDMANIIGIFLVIGSIMLMNHRTHSEISNTSSE
ncbi:putative membrane protein [Propionispora sp. 2/2-37]|uniref:DMT family transporter n=1 Tax=Propionispora sp. 2/2-37 TaxID=1677858 RepID=UPI0006BB75D1|nr:DMT family transporter [Propionispora sp. 2/2-37]CUH96006.1 putative membrane protein [Propionispora sp. 2/2-37]